MASQFEDYAKATGELIAELLVSQNGNVALRDVKGMTDQEINTLYDLGVNVYNAGNMVGAEKVFRGLVLLDHMEARFWLAYGAVAQRQKKYDEAIRRYSMAAFLDLKTPDAAYYAAECFLAKKDFAQARHAALTALDYAPEGNESTKEIHDKASALLAVINASHPELAKADEED